MELGRNNPNVAPTKKSFTWTTRKDESRPTLDPRPSTDNKPDGSNRYQVASSERGVRSWDETEEQKQELEEANKEKNSGMPTKRITRSTQIFTIEQEENQQPSVTPM